MGEQDPAALAAGEAMWMHAPPASTEGLQQAGVGSGMKAGEPKLPVLAQRGGKSILHTEILGMESHPGQQDAGPAAAMLSHDSFGVAVSAQVECGDKEKSALMDVAFPWGDFVLGSCLRHAQPCPGVVRV